MKALFALALSVVFLVAPATASAEDDDDDLGENTITGKRSSALGDASDAEIEAFEARPYAASSYRAAEAMKVDPEMVDGCRAAVELIYQRKYKEARKALDGLTTKYPTSGIGPIGFVLIYQALMFENYDYRYEKQYKLASDQARAQIQKGLAEPGNEAFEQFLLAGVLGIDSIHSMRKGEFLPALNRALEAVNALEATRKIAPDFADPALGDGMYLYWRSAVTMNSKILPQFPDRREEGVALIKKAEHESVFVGPGASLALAYSYIEERNLKGALDRGLHLRMEYPDNVINNMTLGRIYTSMRRYDDALRVYGDILGDAEDNQRVHYHRGIVLARLLRYDESMQAYEKYLTFKEVPKDARGQTYYRIGALYVRKKDFDKAKSYFKQAISTSSNDAAKAALTRIEGK